MDYFQSALVGLPNDSLNSLLSMNVHDLDPMIDVVFSSFGHFPYGGVTLEEGEIVNLSMTRIANLRILHREANNISHHIRWVALCDCGTKRVVSQKGLLDGSIKSCGCIKRELKELNDTQRDVIPVHLSLYSELKSLQVYTHQNTMVSKPIFAVWESLKEKNKLCKLWMNSFNSFYSFVGDKIDNAYLVRKNPNLKFSPSNVLWADVSERVFVNRLKKENYKKTQLRKIVSLEKDVLFKEGQWFTHFAAKGKMYKEGPFISEQEAHRKVYELKTKIFIK